MCVICPRPLTWTQGAEEGFKDCKTALMETTLLVHPNPEAPINITDDDDSGTTMGTVFQQHRYHGTPASTILFAVTQSKRATIKHLWEGATGAYMAVKHHAEGRNFFIITDHKLLIFALHTRTQRHSPREERHLDYSGQFNQTPLTTRQWQKLGRNRTTCSDWVLRSLGLNDT